MKILLITHPGIEDISALETKELIGKKAEYKLGSSVITFETGSYEDIIKLAYKAQSISNILLLLNNIKITKAQDIKKLKIDIHDWIAKDTDFRVVCKRLGQHDFNSKQIEEDIGELIINKYKLKVNLTDPKLIIYAYIFEENLYLGIDFAGLDLSKRDYKIFHHPNSLKANIAYALVRIAGYTKSKKLMDPFCGDGIITIEACLFATGFPVRFFSKEKFAFRNMKKTLLDFDKVFKEIDSAYKDEKLQITGSENLLRHVVSCKKNAKLAGIEKNIEFARYDIEWLDTKFRKAEIDLIVTKIIEPSKLFDRKKVEKIYNDLFYQCDYILKKDGKIVLLAKDKQLITEKAGQYKFKVEINREIKIGDQSYFVLVIKR